MKKLILSIGLFIFLFQSFMGYIYAQDTNQDSNKITCEQIWEIVDTDNCKRWVVSNSEGGVWCNLPDTRESLQPWIYGPPPTYTFTPGTCPVESGDQAEEESKSSQSDQTGQQTQQSNQNNDKNFIGKFFGSNPFDTWLGLNAFAQLGDYIYSDAAIEDIGPLFSPGYAAFQEKERKGQERWDSYFKILNQSRERILKLEGKTGLLEQKELFDAPLKVNAKTGPATIRLSSGMILEFGPLDGQEGVLEQGEYWPMLKSGALDVIFEPQNDGTQFQLQTPNADIFVIGTKFTVVFDPGNQETLLAVYEGKVEVKTKSGETKTVSPNGDKPGVILVTSKPSITQLAIIGVILTAIITGIALFIKRQLAPKGLSKRKR